MAIGVDFEAPDYGEFELLAMSTHGNLKAMASKLSVSPVTLYRHFKKDPELKNILDEVRTYNNVTDVDLAEFVNRYNMSNYKEEPSIAQRAAEFTLGYKGKDRGWVKDDDLKSSDPAVINKAMDLISILQAQSSDLSIADSNINNEDRSKLETGEDIA